MIDTAKAVAIASLERKKSIGGHVRLDAGKSSIFAKPFSTQVSIINDHFKIIKIKRTKTKFKKLLAYKLSEKYRLLKAKMTRYLPYNYRDSILEKKYKKILGEEVTIKIKPGSQEAAPGENINNI